MSNNCTSLDDKIGNFSDLCWNASIKGISLKNICHWGLSFINEGYTNLTNRYKRYNVKSSYTSFPKITTETRALIVFLHGMNSDPKQFIDHFSLYESNKHFALYSPHIYMKGMSSLEQCGESILTSVPANIKNYNIKLIIIGISNGGRLGLWLYPKLRSLFSQVYLTTLGSPLKGTYMANLLLDYKLYYFLHYRNHIDVLKQLRNDSKVSQLLLPECQLDSQFNKNIMTYASKTDILIQPYTNAIVTEGQHKIISGYGHNSMVYHLMRDQYKWCMKCVYSKT